MMMLKIVDAIVLVGRGADKVILNTNLPSPFPKVSGQPLVLNFEAEKGTAMKYLQDNFGLSLDKIRIINMELPPTSFSKKRWEDYKEGCSQSLDKVIEDVRQVIDDRK